MHGRGKKRPKSAGEHDEGDRSKENGHCINHGINSFDLTPTSAANAQNVLVEIKYRVPGIFQHSISELTIIMVFQLLLATQANLKVAQMNHLDSLMDQTARVVLSLCRTIVIFSSAVVLRI